MIHEFVEVNIFEDDMPFGEFVRKKRRLLGLNQSDFGKYLGVHQRTVSNWERGDRSVSIETANKVIKQLGGRIRIENVEDIYPEDMVKNCPFGFNPWQE